MRHTYIIGEIGQNHNGSVDIAKLIVELLTQPIVEPLFNTIIKPMDAVKLTKRDLDYELSASQMTKPYNNSNSFGSTYGEHRKFLELTDNEHFSVYKFAKEKGLDFIETLCAPSTLSILKLFTPDYLKVASRDLTNLPLLEALSETKIPIILSTGMGGDKELDTALNIITKEHTNISILHCTSEYPTKPENVNLNTIPYLIENYKDYIIGFSDHTIGISTPLAAVAMGAEIIEKHITINRNMKGTDQKGSLGPDGIKRMVRDIRVFEKSLGEKELFISHSVKNARIKLERSCAANKHLETGHIISENDMHLLSPGDGIKWENRDRLIGRVVKNKIDKNEIIYLKDLI